MIRRGAPIAPTTTTGLATLAATSIAAAALLLFHEQDVSVMALVWQFGSAPALTGLGALFGRQLLRWRTGVIEFDSAILAVTNPLQMGGEKRPVTLPSSHNDRRRLQLLVKNCNRKRFHATLNEGKVTK